MDEYEDINEALGTAPDVSTAVGLPPTGRSASTAYQNRMAPLGRTPDPVLEANTSDLAWMMAPPALRGAGMLARAAPKTAASILAALGLGGTAEATGEGEFKWNDPDKDRSARINQFEQTMNNLNKEMVRASKARMPSVQKQMDQLLIQHNALLGERQKERDAAFQTWQEQNAARIEAERPFREKYPVAYRTLPLAGWGASALGGLLGSKGGKPIQSMVGGALGGIPGSAAAAVGPTAYDAATLPTGSKHQKQAGDWLADPRYWLTRVGPEVLTGMGLGAMGGKFGSYRPGPKPPGAGPTATPASASPPAASPAATPAPVASALPPPPAGWIREGGFLRNKWGQGYRDPFDPANAAWYAGKPGERERIIAMLKGGETGQILQRSRENASRVQSVLRP